MSRRNTQQREQDLHDINFWYCQGRSQHWIVQELARTRRDYEVTQQTVSNDLKEVRKRWAEARNAARDAHIERELAKIDALEAEYWQSWLRSRENAETTTKRVKEGKDRQYDASTKVEERDGNPAFLAGVERCIQMRVKLLGLNAPEQVEEHSTIRWEVVRDDDNSPGNYPPHRASSTASGAEDNL